MLQGCTDGTATVAPVRSPLAQLLTANNTTTAGDNDKWLSMISNSITSPTDPEIWYGTDAFTWDSRGSVTFDIVANQNRTIVLPGTNLNLVSVAYNLPPQASEATYQTIKTFLANYVDAHKSQYTITQDPTWRFKQ
jgi:hypothetical protein